MKKIIRSNYSADIKYHREIELGVNERKFSDGRNVYFEHWYDCDTEYEFITLYYKSFDIETWTSEQHKIYLLNNGFDIDGYSLAIRRITRDDIDLWQITFLSPFSGDYNCAALDQK